MGHYLAIVLAPLIAAATVGIFGKSLGHRVSHTLCIAGVFVAFALSSYTLYSMIFQGASGFEGTLYEWASSGNLRFEVGFLVDRLSALMMVVVTFVSLMVHIYTIGYMHDDPGYERFFSYISLFTFAMLMLVMSNNFFQLFFGWEAVGVVSYLLIGFWFKKPTAIHANLKAFLVNRVGDFGFLLGIGAIAMLAGSLNYAEVFGQADQVAAQTLTIFGDTAWNAMTVTCILLFVGAMGKSAQVPLHVWLPDSMEGPTPISALIHAATMVTAGIFMVARMSPLFELSTTALSFVMWIGAITAFFMGLLGLIQNDIKRVVAYSTLSQLGYMTVALGVSAYSAGIFHLMTHAFFKALLFLAAGSVIIAMHHEQDIRKMGGLRRYLPITYITALIGSLALIGFPGFSGFYSKDVIIEAVHASHLGGAGFVYWVVLLGVFVTALYSFRMFFLVFHGKERMDEQTRSHLKEPGWVVTLPLVLLAIPSLVIGGLTMRAVLFDGYFGNAIVVDKAHDTVGHVAKHVDSVLGFTLHAPMTLAFWLAIGGVATAGYIYLLRPGIADMLQRRFAPVYRLFENKYYFDRVYESGLARGTLGFGRWLWRVGDETIIDGAIVNGTAKGIGVVALIARRLQSGYLYHYAFAMVIGLAVLLGWLVFG